MRKISIVGAGRVGEVIAQILAQEECSREIALLDVHEGLSQGVALDILQSAPYFGFDTLLQGSDDARILKDSELVIVTAGVPRKPGMSRADVLETNVHIIDQVTDAIMTHAPDAMVLVVSNPVDTLTYRVAQRTGWGRDRVFGQAGVLDGARMASFIAQETGFSAKDITTMVLGGHGDSMVPVPRFCSVNGVPISYFLSEERIEAINERTRMGGAEILTLRKTASAYDAPGTAVATMVDAIANNRRRLLPCVALLEGEYGETDIAMGVPCVLGAKGLDSIIELQLNEREQADFKRSALAVRSEIERLRAIP